MKHYYNTGSLLLFFSFLFFTLPSHSQWTSNTALNTPVDPASNSNQPLSVTTSDGKTFISYYKQDGSNYNMYLQLLDAQGVKQFGSSGQLISSYPSGSATFVYNLALDQNDNAIISFQDERTGSQAGVAYKVTTGGTQLWGSSGVVLGPGLAPHAAALPSGDVVIGWNPATSGSISYQKYDAAGTGVWPSVKSYTHPGGGNISFPRMFALSNNEFIMLYKKPAGTFFITNVYAQRFDLNGDPVWPSPVMLSTGVTNFVNAINFVPDGNDGLYCSFPAAVTSPVSNEGIVQHLRSDGSLGFGITGAKFTTATNINEYENFLAIDTVNQALWMTEIQTDINQNNAGVFVQKFDTSGNRLFGNSAIQLLPISAPFYRPGGISMMDSSAVVVYTDDATNQINAAKINPDGTTAWLPFNTLLCSVSNVKSDPSLGLYRNDQVVLVWSDGRGGSDGVYAQNITKDGLIGPTGISNISDGTGLLISAFPNPVKSGDYFNLSIQNRYDAEIKFELLNASGSILSVNTDYVLANEEKLVSINLKNVSSGIYSVRLILGTEVRVVRLAVTN